MNKPIKYADALHRIAKLNEILRANPVTVKAFQENFKSAANRHMPWFQHFGGYKNFMQYHRTTCVEAYVNTVLQVTLPPDVQKNLDEIGFSELVDFNIPVDKPRIKNTFAYFLNDDFDILKRMMRFHVMMGVVETGRRTIGVVFKPMS